MVIASMLARTQKPFESRPGPPRRTSPCRRRRFGLAGLIGGWFVLMASGAGTAEPLFLHEMTYVGSEAGTKDVVLEALRARVELADDQAHLEVVTMDAAGTGGETTLLMTCDRALLHLSTNDFFAEGNVRGTTGDGYRFSTTWANFDHAERLVASDAPVAIVDPDGTLYRGVGFRYHVREGRMEMRQATVED